MVPNHPRYQLRYTRIFTFRFLEISLSVVKAVVKCNFGVHFNGRSNPAIDRVPRASGVSVLLGSDTGTALPNHARYQLRYTRVAAVPFAFRRSSEAPALRRERPAALVLYIISGGRARDFLIDVFTALWYALKRSVISYENEKAAESRAAHGEMRTAAHKRAGGAPRALGGELSGL